MVKVNGLKFQIIRRWLCRQAATDTARHDVLYVESLAVFVISTLALVCGNSTAPKKTFWKLHTTSFL